MAGPIRTAAPRARCSHPAPEAAARVACGPPVGGAEPLAQARTAPRLDDSGAAHRPSDDELVGELRELGGTTAGPLDGPAPRRVVLPATRADHLDGRREHTTAAVRAVELPGGHFHPVERQEAVRGVLPGTLRRLEVGR
ncbi:hypothetical protein L6E12_12000 [Actinokineospora sp. PR83]|uniref:hypothetical protein n=1 Tax=Actinokineospora sp. PR83 TaxID=2884908 RepID=UPI001F1E663E|nr:hypothetical protein [Actinokineospora sp. PR83]MCG8916511.1 hypothetical protein [Actinokineospora sp. PR83]